MSISEVTPTAEAVPEPKPALRIVEPPAPRTTEEWLCRRINTALLDLGLTRIVGRDWAEPDDRGVAFRRISVKAADGLACLLEDLTRSLEVEGDVWASDEQAEPVLSAWAALRAADAVLRGARA